MSWIKCVIFLLMFVFVCFKLDKMSEKIDRLSFPQRDYVLENEIKLVKQDSIKRDLILVDHMLAIQKRVHGEKIK